MELPKIFLESPKHLLEFLIAPIISVQLFVTILIYFVIVRKRIAVDYKLYIIFIATLIFFIGGRLGDIFLDKFGATILLFARMTLLFAVGIPSLLVASAKLSNIEKTKTVVITSYIIGALISITYMFFMLVHRKTKIFPEYKEYNLSWLVIENPRLWAHRTQVMGAVLLLVIPCAFFIIKEIKTNKNIKQLAFLFGAFLFGLAFTIGLGLTPRNFGLYYVVSIVSGLFWIWAVFRDIQDMKGKVSIVKEELQLLVRSDSGGDVAKINKLLNNLEALSLGNLDVYKLRIRDILNMLTDITISAGGDTQSLIVRNYERSNAIQISHDTSEIRKIISEEAKEFSKILSETSRYNNDKYISEAIKYLESNFTEDLSVDDIADKVGLSRAYFMREFKKRTGKTLNQYLTSIRIEQAKKILSDKTVTQTAYLIGYNNPNYFSTVFKKHVGISPAQYQQQN